MKNLKKCTLTMIATSNLFWTLYIAAIAIIILVTVLVYNEKLDAAIVEKSYVSEDIDKLTQTLREEVEEGNETYISYGIGMSVSPYYQVYTAQTGNTALVVYEVTFRNKTYSIYGEAPSNYFTGLSSLLAERQELIDSGNLVWNNNTIITPEPTSNPIDESVEPGTAEEDYIIERGEDW